MDPRAPRGPRTERWVDEAAGPLVRPYAMTRGRTRPSGEPLDIVAILVATGASPAEPLRLPREQRRLLALCRLPHTVADLASEMALPLGVIRVLAGDLLDHGLVEVQRWAPPSVPISRPEYAPLPAPTSAPHTDQNLLRMVLDELRAL